MEAKTIQIFLPAGEPRGIRIAEITTRIVQAIQVPRTHLHQFFERDECKSVGLYFLIGDKDNPTKPSVYIGQTEDLKSRLKNHHVNKEFWTSAIIIVSRTQNFTQAHIRYLEWHSIKEATAAKRYQLDNGNEGSKPFVTEPMEADVLDAFETTRILLSTLGFPIFEPPAGKPASAPQRETFYCRGPDAEASGTLAEDGFVVLQGSLVRATPVPSAQGFQPWLKELAEAGILVIENDRQYRVTQDYLVNSPSYAAALVLGRHANGWHEWKREDGKSLHEIYRQQSNTE